MTAKYLAGTALALTILGGASIAIAAEQSQQSPMSGMPGMMGQGQGMMGQGQGMMGQGQGMMGHGQGMMGHGQGMMGQGQGMMGAMGCPMMSGGMMGGTMARGARMPMLPPGNEKLQLQMHAEIMQKVGEIMAKYANQLPPQR